MLHIIFIIPCIINSIQRKFATVIYLLFFEDNETSVVS